MDLIQIIILGVIQGITEFLPISSSGHLVVCAALLEACGYEELPDLLEVNVALHLGTLLAVVVFYWRRVWQLCGEDRRVLVMLVLGTFPAVVVGLPLKKMAPELLESPQLAGLMFLVTGGLLIWSRRLKVGISDYQSLSVKQVLLVGIFQAIAILPGVSRSGATIIAGLAVGLKRDAAATFAFLLAIPAIAGAGVLESLDLIVRRGAETPMGYLAIGAMLSFIVGLLSLWALIQLVQRGRLAYFAFWCIPLGIAVSIWQWLA